jgi:hypothetical protein
MRGDGRLLQLNSYENRVYLVHLEDGRPVVAKFYRPGRWTDAQILEEHAFAGTAGRRSAGGRTRCGRRCPAGATLAHHGLDGQPFRWPCTHAAPAMAPSWTIRRCCNGWAASSPACTVGGERAAFVHRRRLTPTPGATRPWRACWRWT